MVIMAVLIVHHPCYTKPLPRRQGFSMGKYARLIQLLRQQGLATARTCHAPDLALRWCLELAHDSDYVDAILEQTADSTVMPPCRHNWRRAPRPALAARC